MLDEKELKGKPKVNFRKINEILKLSHNVLKVFYVLIFIVCFYVVIKVCQELNVLNIIIDILKILVPLFIGIVIWWLFNPIVTRLEKKGVKRIISVIFVYVILIGIISLIVGSILPILYDQIVSFAHSIPNLVTEMETFLNHFMERFNNIDGFNVESIKINIANQLETYGENISAGLPSYVINIIRALVSSISTFLIGLIIGFFLLLSSKNVGGIVINLVPEAWRKDFSKLINKINNSLRNYVLGVLIDAVVIFIICSIAFSLIGLKAPLLFAVFCAITNVIPYVGPYIGAVPALIVAFSMNTTIGILVLIAIAVIQFIEGNFLQEYIMSKTTKLHPVSIITGLLIFGHYWGILGMIISTPIISIVKQLWIFFNTKYNFLRKEENEYE